MDSVPARTGSRENVSADSSAPLKPKAGLSGPPASNGATKSATAPSPFAHRRPAEVPYAEHIMVKNSIPRHVGFIPDGNRRWAVDRGLSKESGYAHGIGPGLRLYEKCREIGVEEVSIYGFTQDN